jgi:hypothetical protein
MDFKAYADAMDGLLAVVAADRRLSDFLPQVTELRDQARAGALGATEVPRLPIPPRRSIPDRATAEVLLERINKIPFYDPEKEDSSALPPFYGLTRNLVIAIWRAIMEDFPDLVSLPAEEEPKEA